MILPATMHECWSQALSFENSLAMNPTAPWLCLKIYMAMDGILLNPNIKTLCSDSNLPLDVGNFVFNFKFSTFDFGNL